MDEKSSSPTRCIVKVRVGNSCRKPHEPLRLHRLSR
nr:MAG TPA: hypothetical protein [Microviridae sp.]